jgi:ABC-2 type transport system permease protein
MKFNYSAFKAIYLHEMDRFKRTLMQSLLSPVLSTSLYFIVFGSVIGGYVEKIDGISYGSYIVPGSFNAYIINSINHQHFFWNIFS